MRVKNGGAYKIFFKIAIINCIILLFILFGIYAAVRISASFRTDIDGVTSGGGAAQSDSYKQKDGAIGESASGFSSSTNYKNNGGIVQPWGPYPSKVSDWQIFVK